MAHAPSTPVALTRRRWSLALGLSAGGWLLGCTAPQRTPVVGYTLLDGSKGTTSAWRGKVVLVNFWATSCATCVREMPRLADLHRAFAAQGMQTLAVAMRHDPPALVARFAELHNLPFGVAIDNTGEIARQFDDVRLTPTTLLIDRQGLIVERHVGEPDFSALRTRITGLLGQA